MPTDNNRNNIHPLNSYIGRGPTGLYHDIIEDWLDSHPEAVIGIHDNSIANDKLVDKTIKNDKISNKTIVEDLFDDKAVSRRAMADNAVGPDQLDQTGVTSGSYGDTTAQAPNFGETFKAISFTVDEDGRMTAAGDHNVTIPFLPEMSESTPGIAKVGAGLAMYNGAVELAGDGDIATAVTEWLNAHPEATTTVQDGSVTETKLSSSVLNRIDEDFIVGDLTYDTGEYTYVNYSAVSKDYIYLPEGHLLTVHLGASNAYLRITRFDLDGTFKSTQYWLNESTSRGRFSFQSGKGELIKLSIRTNPHTTVVDPRAYLMSCKFSISIDRIDIDDIGYMLFGAGGLNASTGEEYPITSYVYAVRSEFVHFNIDKIDMKVKEGFRLRLFEYDLDGTFSSIVADARNESPKSVNIQNDKLYRFDITKIGDTTALAPDDVESYISISAAKVDNDEYEIVRTFNDWDLYTGSPTIDGQGQYVISLSLKNVAHTRWISVVEGSLVKIKKQSSARYRIVGMLGDGSFAYIVNYASSQVGVTEDSFIVPKSIRLIQLSLDFSQFPDSSSSTYFYKFYDKASTSIEYCPGQDYDRLPKSLVPFMSSDVVKLNNLYDVMAQATRRRNEGNSGYAALPEVFTMIHFSDIHGSQNIRGIRQMRDAYSSIVDDVICTGDIVAARFINSTEFWGSNDNTILTCIGNHDSLDGNSGYDWTQVVNQSDLYDKFIAPYASSWNATTVTNKCWYYKDYAAKKMRLIVLDTTVLDVTDKAAQVSWLTSRLSEAKTLGYSVICAEHFPAVNGTKIPCSFTSIIKPMPDLTPHSWSTYYTAIMDEVQDFIEDGGDFVCWLCGHSHYDLINYQPDYPRQLFVTVTCAIDQLTYPDSDRTFGEKSQDAFNFVSVDTTSKLVKIVRVGQDRDFMLRHLGTLVLDYSTSPATVQYED